MKREALDYIWEKFNSCYPFVHEDYKENIVWVYDKQVLRQKKLNRIVGESEIKVDKASKDSIWYFYQDNKNGYFNINHKEIWSEIESKFGYNYNEIKELFVGWLEEHDKLKGLTPVLSNRSMQVWLEEHDKLKGLTPTISFAISYVMLEEHDKIKGLTPHTPFRNDWAQLEEHDKIKGLTPIDIYPFYKVKLEEHDKRLTPAYGNPVGYQIIELKN